MEGAMLDVEMFTVGNLTTADHHYPEQTQVQLVSMFLAAAEFNPAIWVQTECLLIHSRSHTPLLPHLLWVPGGNVCSHHVGDVANSGRKRPTAPEPSGTSR